MDARRRRLYRDGIGMPRVTIAALADLHQLLIEHGFRQRSSDGSTIVLEKQFEALADINIAFRHHRTSSVSRSIRQGCGMTAAERRISLARLASLLLDAAGESNNGER
jgi:hypothetical protein